MRYDMSLESNMRALVNNSLFSVMEVEARRLMAFSSEQMTFRQGDVIFKQGDKSDAGYFILNGSVELRRDHNGQFVSQIVGRHFLIGEMAMISETIRPTSAFAREKIDCIKISRTVFHKVLREFPDTAITIKRLIEKRVTIVIDQLSNSFSSFFHL